MMTAKVKLVRTTTTATPVTVGAVTVTPQARVVMVRLPFGFFVWNRPAAVLVASGGSVKRIPIWDVTRSLRLGIGIVGLAIAAVAAARHRSQEVRR